MDNSIIKLNSKDHGSNGQMMNGNFHDQNEDKNYENDLLADIQLDYDIGTGDCGDISCMNVHDLKTKDEADDTFVIDDEEDIIELPNVLSKVNKVCELTQEQLIHLVKENKKYLRNIYQGKVY
ncbi:unnamed protein product, partial [Owenia fusiformis]